MLGQFDDHFGAGAVGVGRMSGPADSPAVMIEGVSYTYPARGLRDDSVTALKRVSLAVPRGTRLGILGPNGGASPRWSG